MMGLFKKATGIVTGGLLGGPMGAQAGLFGKQLGKLGGMFGLGGGDSGGGPMGSPFVNVKTDDYGIQFDPTTQTLGMTEGGIGRGFRTGAQRAGQEIMGGTQGAEDKAYDLLMQRAQPGFEQSRGMFETMMAKRGIPVGSRAFGSGLENLASAQDTARREAALSAMGEGRARMGSSRENLASLLSARQGLTQPFTSLAPFAANPAYQSAIDAQQKQQDIKAQRQGSLIGLAGTMGGALFSDKRLKEDIKKVGELLDGTPVYTFKYKKVDDVEDTAYYMGVMAQEVEEKYPEVISEIHSEHGDFKLVNYKELGERVSGN